MADETELIRLIKPTEDSVRGLTFSVQQSRESKKYLREKDRKRLMRLYIQRFYIHKSLEVDKASLNREFRV